MVTQYFLKKSISINVVIFFFCMQAFQLAHADALPRAFSATTNQLIKDCCDDLADDIFATQTIILAKIDAQTATLLNAFAQTNSLIANTCSGGGGVCCDKIIKKIDEQTAILQADFEFTWSKIDVQSAEIHDQFLITWSLIESIQTGSVCCNQILNKIDQQTAILLNAFEFTWSKIDVQSAEIHDQFLITWSLIESIQTGSVCCNQILNKIDQQTAILLNAFEFTWSKIDVQSAEIHDQFLITWSLIESIQTGSICCNQILNKIDEQTAILQADFEFTWSKIDVQSAEIHDQFLFTWSLIESIQTGSVCCDQILARIDELQAFIEAEFNILFGILSRLFCKGSCCPNG